MFNLKFSEWTHIKHSLRASPDGPRLAETASLLTPTIGKARLQYLLNPQIAYKTRHFSKDNERGFLGLHNMIRGSFSNTSDLSLGLGATESGLFSEVSGL